MKTHTIIPNQPTPEMLALLGRNNPDTHKGTYGCLSIIGGNRGMQGALILSGMAALYSGAGKVILTSLSEDFKTYDICPELMTRQLTQTKAMANTCDAVAIGVGFGVDERAKAVLVNSLGHFSEPPMVLDADALNLIACDNDLKAKVVALPNKIMTPHPSEASRLLHTTTQAVQENRRLAVEKLSQTYNAISILKGHQTLISVDGDVYCNHTGNPGMSNAGQGDVLTGLIGSFLAQGIATDWAARMGVYFHGAAADRLLEKDGGHYGITASAVAKEIPRVINAHLKHLRSGAL